MDWRLGLRICCRAVDGIAQPKMEARTRRGTYYSRPQEMCLLAAPFSASLADWRPGILQEEKDLSEDLLYPRLWLVHVICCAGSSFMRTLSAGS